MPRPLPPSRFRRIAKWTGLVVCVVILATWVVSKWYGVLRSTDTGVIAVGGGRIQAHWKDRASSGEVKWRHGPIDGGIGFFFPRIERHVDGPFEGLFLVVVPLWLPFTLAAIPTAILWHRDRRTVKPGRCRQCGYDLRASKKTCPECGAPIVPVAR